MTHICPHCGNTMEDPSALPAEPCSRCGRPLWETPLRTSPASDVQVVKFRTFRSFVGPWEGSLQEAAEFAAECGPDKLITITQSADNSVGIVVVWYWDVR